MRSDGQTSKGAFGRSVRPLPDHEFEAILAVGFSGLPTRAGPDDSAPEEVGERRRIEVTLNRPFRDEAFRRHVRKAYENRCAISGLGLINGGGRPEVHAAHIQPVAHAGPDSVRNGIALSGTLHWLFDRGLVTADECFRIICANGLPSDVLRLVRPDATLLLPRDHALRPHPAFLEFHRRNVSKG